MSTAVARVEQRIVITGADNASDAVNKAKNSLKQLEATAKSTGQAAGKVDLTKGIRESSGDLESALKGIKDFTPGVAGQLSGLGDAFGAVEATMRLLPGPIGLVATALTAAGVGGFLLAEHLNQAAAKARLLVSAEAGKLAERLQLDTDGAVRLSAALGDLGERGLRPSDALMRQVGANAKALGAEPAEAIAKFIAAWKDGPEAVRRVQQELGNVNVVMQSLSATARSVGLDPRSLGLDQAASSADRLKQGLTELAKLRANLTAVESEATRLTNESASKRVHELVALQAQAKAQREIAAGLREQIAGEEAAARFRANKVETEQAFAALSKRTGEIQADANVHADLALNRQLGLGLRLRGISDAQAAVSAQIAREQALIAAGTGKEAQDRLKALNAQMLQLAVQEKALVDADASERKAKAKQAADQSNQARVAAAEAALRLQRAQADADGTRTRQERLALLDAEAAKERLSVQVSAVAAKTKAALLQAVDQELQNKRLAVSRELAAEHKKRSDDALKELEAANRKTEELQRGAATAVANATKARAQTMSEALRAAGKEEQALLVESRQAHADHAAELLRIDRELAAARDAADGDKDDIAALETTATAQRIAVREALLQAEQRIAGQRKQIQAASAQQLRQDIAAAAQSLQAAAQFSNGAVGRSVAAVAQGIAQVAQGWKSMRESAGDAISAVGAVAAGFVQSERKKAGILAITEAAAAAASYPNIPAMIAHSAAATLYAAAAADVIPTASGSAGTPGGGGGSLGGGSVAGGGQLGGQAGGQVVQVVFSKGFVVGTPQQVGKAVASAVGSLQGTGFKPGKGV